MVARSRIVPADRGDRRPDPPRWWEVPLLAAVMAALWAAVGVVLGATAAVAVWTYRLLTGL